MFDKYRYNKIAERIKKNYSKYKFIVVGDALYGTTPIINICKKNKWYYIFNLKTEKLKEVSSVIFKEKKISHYLKLHSKINYSTKISLCKQIFTQNFVYF